MLRITPHRAPYDELSGVPLAPLKPLVRLNHNNGIVIIKPYQNGEVYSLHLAKARLFAYKKTSFL